MANSHVDGHVHIPCRCGWWNFFVMLWVIIPRKQFWRRWTTLALRAPNFVKTLLLGLLKSLLGVITWPSVREPKFGEGASGMLECFRAYLQTTSVILEYIKKFGVFSDCFVHF
jgi:hypothetical protein